VSFGVVFWLLGVLLTPLVCWGALRIGPRLGLEWFAYPIVLIFLTGYGLLVSVAIWRSSARSSASRVWVYGARSAVALGWVIALSVIGFAVIFIRPDFSTTSYTIQAELQPDSALPYIGFWKPDCADNFGFAVQKASADAYFVRFCGPGGCRGKTPLFRTKLIGDPRYRILDRDRIALNVGVAHQPDLPALSPEDRERYGKTIRNGLLIIKRCQ
jgi:hypothetical protein